MNSAVVQYTQGTARLLVNQNWCKGCGLCVDACPPGILELDVLEKIFMTDVNSCIFCGLCVARCPDFVFILERPTLEATL